MSTTIDSLILGAMWVGTGATLFMDLWTLLLRRMCNVPSLSYCVVGRWLSLIPSGQFTHANIAAIPRAPAECVIGWIAHYVIGIAYALGLLLVAPTGWIEQPTALPALLFGIATIVFPFFVMQPGLGMGIAAAKSANPLQARIKTTINHAVFGVGLYASAAIAGYI